MENPDKKIQKSTLLHLGFDIGITVKGILAVLEILGGLAMIFVTPDRLNGVIWHISGNGSRHGWLMNTLTNWGQTFTSDAQFFVIFYAISHGAVKLAVVILLWLKKLWAYPVSIVVLLMFIVYQMDLFFRHYSIYMILLTVFDIVMIMLTVFEYKRVKNNRQEIKTND